MLFFDQGLPSWAPWELHHASTPGLGSTTLGVARAPPLRPTREPMTMSWTYQAALLLALLAGVTFAASCRRSSQGLDSPSGVGAARALHAVTVLQADG